VANYKYLGLWYLRINSQHRSNCKCASLARPVLALRNQVNVLVLVWLDDHWDGNTLNVGGLEELQLLDNASENVLGNFEVVIVFPGSLLVYEWRGPLLRF
jgi:hypothetical protein